MIAVALPAMVVVPEGPTMMMAVVAEAVEFAAVVELPPTMANWPE